MGIMRKQSSSEATRLALGGRHREVIEEEEEEAPAAVPQAGGDV